MEVYKKIIGQFRPVFHHFFLEKFPDPHIWFHKRINYIRSTAASSMIGYIVGLGDRHAQNILIDQNTCEVVHIDLGVAFDQGRTLRTPEVVPFRLTRDIVDGMGLTGTEGVFRRCCEETLKVLRQRSNELITIASVFIHDPLFKWSLSPLKALQIQPDEISSNLPEQYKSSVMGKTNTRASTANTNANTTSSISKTNTEAQRVLLRLKQKLQGIEYGEPLSIEAQVRQLIDEAQEPERLCKMFPGWAPWA
eukprot:TRINITY_DN8699_c0_g1_i2.p1 TRINITY_DN8699_c0_g1~~TRINITY_DN8699_c0_g1_i2.p1  ORF type:complete len:275 (-),score=74.01 TRINITY_DN8699_c0_g1_i2:189-938(-)